MSSVCNISNSRNDFEYYLAFSLVSLSLSFKIQRNPEHKIKPIYFPIDFAYLNIFINIFKSQFLTQQMNEIFSFNRYLSINYKSHGSHRQDHRNSLT